MCPILNRMDHTNALLCTLEGASCSREVTYHDKVQSLA